jgi:hypothetical protein
MRIFAANASFEKRELDPILSGRVGIATDHCGNRRRKPYDTQVVPPLLRAAALVRLSRIRSSVAAGLAAGEDIAGS